MRSLHIIPRALLLLLLAVGEVSAQPTGNASKTIEFADRLQIWRQAQDLFMLIFVKQYPNWDICFISFCDFIDFI